MKISILTFLAVCLIFSSCSKSGSPTPTSKTTTLNTTESNLLGYWYISKQIDSTPTSSGPIMDTLIAQGSPFINFKSDLFTDYTVNGSAKNCTMPAAYTSSPEISAYWYYDQTVQKLDLNGQMFIVNVSGSNLILKENISGMYLTLYLHR